MTEEIIFLTGEDSFFRRKEKKNLLENRKKIDPKAKLSFFTLDQALKFKETRNALEQKTKSQSLFSEKEIVFIKVKKPEGKKNARIKKEDLIFAEDFLVSICQKKPSSLSLVIELEYSPDKKSVLFERLEKQKSITFLNFPLSSGNQKFSLEKYIQDFFRKENLSLNQNLVKKILIQKESGLWEVSNALEQLKLLSASKKIRDEDLFLLWDVKEEETIFAFLDAALRKDQKKAFSLLYRIIAENTLKFGDEKKAILGLISLLRKQIKQLLAFKEGISPEEAFKKWRVPTFAFSKIKFQSSLFEEKFLIQIFSQLISVTEKVKSGQNSPLPLLDFLVLRIISH